MIDRIFRFESTRVRQRAAPLLEEREAFLSHLYNSSTSIDRLKSIASALILIVRFMELRSLRFIEPSEVETAARRWCADPCRVRGKYPKSPRHFTTVAMRWFRFAGVISPAVTVKSESESLLEQFHRYISIDRGFSAFAIRSYTERVSHFLLWAKSKQLTFSDIGICDVSDYLRYCSERGLKPKTTNGIVAALRAFFRYSATLGLNTSRIARSIKYQTVSRYTERCKGPEWRDVRRLLDHGFGTTPSELRAAAIVSLSAIYALRRCEIVRLKLSDIDWVSETITVRRGKSVKIQKFPLQFEVGQKILNYLRDGRAKCACRNLFVTLKPPYKPLEPSVTYDMVSRRLQCLNIQSASLGLHSLRHSCATKLLREGSSLKEIAEFLGHSDMSSVSLYAKFDVKTLENVGEFSLAGLI